MEQVKIVRLIIRKKELSLAEFKDHWLKNYLKLEKRLAIETPVLRVVASFALPPESVSVAAISVTGTLSASRTTWISRSNNWSCSVLVPVEMMTLPPESNAGTR